jgi:hypothetical protein
MRLAATGKEEEKEEEEEEEEEEAAAAVAALQCDHSSEERRCGEAAATASTECGTARAAGCAHHTNTRDQHEWDREQEARSKGCLKH